MYKNKALWHKLQVTAMSQDYSWKISAEHYISLYNKALSSQQDK